jgi:membrane protein YfhO
MPNLRRIARSEHFRALALLFIILNLCFLPFVWGNKTLLDSAQEASSVMPTGAWAGAPSPLKFSKTLDSGAGGFFAEPNLPLLRYLYFHEKVVPLWDPYQAYGRPLAANQQSQPFYPLTLALLLHIGPRTYNWFLLSRLFVAGIASYLYLRFFVSFWPGIAGGITSMLAGYYLLYLTLPQLSVEVLLPASLLAAEHLLRKRTYSSIVAFAIVLLLVFLGGMPESALLLLTLLYCYVLFRIASDPALRATYWKALASVAAATGAGISLAAFFLLPFWELMGRSLDLHQPRNLGGWLTGLYHESLGVSIVTYFFPLLLGRLGLRNYIGLISAFLLLVALMSCLRKTGTGEHSPLFAESEAYPRFARNRPNDKALRAITWFFLCFTAFLVLKRYGFPGINAIGALPFFNMVNFPKYEECPLSICVSILAAIGLERLVRRDLSRRAQAIALAAAALLIPIALWFARHTTATEPGQLHLRAFSIVAIAVPSILILGVAAALIFSGRRLAPVLVALLAAGMWMSFIAPTYYWFNRLPRQTHNPYLGAPYVDVLKKQTGNYRTFARDGLLFPNWSAAFQVEDIRGLDAMYEQKYLPFVGNFFRDQNLAPQEDLHDRFHGRGSYLLTTPLAERLLQLSSVKYIASLRPFTIPNRMVDQILAQNNGHLTPGKEVAIQPREFILSGEARNALGEHPPYSRLPYRIQIPPDPKEIFAFSYALDPAVFDKTAGDGVEFIIELKDPAGRITQQFSRYIDPKHNPRQQHWIDGAIDLSAWRNQSVELLFTTTPGPKGDTSYDWAAWSNFRFEGQPTLDNPPPFQLIYNREAKIYRYDNVLPRAAIYHHAELVPSEGAVLNKLLDPSLDIFQSVVLNQSALTADERGQIAEINRQPLARVESASIESYRSQDVKIEAILHRSGILVLNDTSYPGWTATVDGHAAKWTNANYLFRAVLLAPGKHTIRFRYQPKSFRWGAAISLAMLGLLAAGFAIRKRREKASRSRISEVHA